MVDKFSDEESAAVQRALGRLEGQFQSHVARQTNFEATVQRQMETIAKELIAVRESVSDLQSRMTEERWFVRGSWRTLMFFITGISATVLFVIQIINFFMELPRPK